MVAPIPDTPDPGGDVADLLHAVTQRLRRESRRELAPGDATWAQLRALRTLERRGPGTRMSELADALHVARRSATSLVDELEARGLVERRHDTVDRRAITVAVTDRGRRALDEARARRRAAGARVLGQLSPAELDTLREILARLAHWPATDTDTDTSNDPDTTHDEERAAP